MYQSESFKYIKVNFGKCSEGSCYTEDEIEDYLLENGSFTVDFLIANVQIDPESSKPIQGYILTQL